MSASMSPHVRIFISASFLAGILLIALSSVAAASDDTLSLPDLINEALRKSPELLAAQSRASASRYRVPQAKSLPDPMLMFGYQNEGWGKYSFGESQMSWWMFSASQSFPFPGKLSLRGEMAEKESEGLQESYGAARLKIVEKVRDLYYDLFSAYKDIDIIKERTSLFSKMEEAARARYSAGLAPQQEMLMAQTEKYMLAEKEEMLKQKIQSLEAMLNTTVGRDVNAPLGRPAETAYEPFGRKLGELISLANENSPEIKVREKMVAASEAAVRIAEKDFYPDFTITGNVMKRTGEFDDMWSLTTAMNIPIFYRSKQRQAVNEAKASLGAARNELESTKLMVSSNLRDAFSMMKSAENLMGLYKDGLVPKSYQDFELALAGYVSGKVDALTVINRLRALLDYETLYWKQFVEREKAIARLEAITGIQDSRLTERWNEKE